MDRNKAVEKGRESRQSDPEALSSLPPSAMTGLKISTSFNEHDLSSEDTITILTHLTAARELINCDTNANSQIIWQNCQTVNRYDGSIIAE